MSAALFLFPVGRAGRFQLRYRRIPAIVGGMDTIQFPLFSLQAGALLSTLALARLPR
ncbi:hypothetical protein PUN4_750049 [Paraburkholderia unamae]|nr:hypothetical protein PUN4_750049 [Paraburkholderia unamae]